MDPLRVDNYQIKTIKDVQVRKSRQALMTEPDQKHYSEQ